MRASVLLIPVLLAACAAPPPAAVENGRGRAVRVDGPDDLLERAMALHAVGRHEEAADLVDALLVAHDDYAKSESARFLGAEACYQAGEFERAHEAFVALLERFPTTRAHAIVPDRFYVIGEALVKAPRPQLGGLLEDRSVGIDALSRLVVHYPEWSTADDAWLLLAAAHRAEGAWDLADEAYRRLLVRYFESPLREEAAWGRVDVARRKWKGPAYDASPLAQEHLALVAYLNEFGVDGRFGTAAKGRLATVAEDVARHRGEVDTYYDFRADD